MSSKSANPSLDDTSRNLFLSKTKWLELKLIIKSQRLFIRNLSFLCDIQFIKIVFYLKSKIHTRNIPFP